MKRAFDITVAALSLVLLSPVLAVVAVLVAVKLGRPVIFRQRRPGLHGHIFSLYKFRSMTNARGPDGEPLPDAERLTSFGRFLRSSSLDELPELWNVLRGDMSLVGPRPLLVQYLGRYSDEQARRHDVRPGITGWAQVNGRNETPWDERLKMDVWYVDNHNLSLDLQILWRTVAAVFRREGISSGTHATKEEFMGGANGER